MIFGVWGEFADVLLSMQHAALQAKMAELLLAKTPTPRITARETVNVFIIMV